MSKTADGMPQIVNRKAETEPEDKPLETKSEGEEAVEDLKDGD